MWYSRRLVSANWTYGCTYEFQKAEGHALPAVLLRGPPRRMAASENMAMNEVLPQVVISPTDIHPRCVHHERAEVCHERAAKLGLWAPQRPYWQGSKGVVVVACGYLL
jgi:hypothetical protein